MEPKPTRLYYGGPIRMFSVARFLGGTPYAGGGLSGFAGRFICCLCKTETHRVLFEAGDWICRDCATAWRRRQATECNR